MENRNSLLEQLEVEERVLSYRINDIEDEKKIVERIEDSYHEIFYHLQHSFSEINQLMCNSRKLALFSEIFTDIKREEHQINEQLYMEKITLEKEYRQLEDKEREIFHQKKKLLLEEE